MDDSGTLPVEVFALSLVSIGAELLVPPVGLFSSVVIVLTVSIVVGTGRVENVGAVRVTFVVGMLSLLELGSGKSVETVTISELVGTVTIDEVMIVGWAVLLVPVGPSKPVLVVSLHGYGAPVPLG